MTINSISNEKPISVVECFIENGCVGMTTIFYYKKPFACIADIMRHLSLVE